MEVEIVGGVCGPSVSNPANAQCILIGKGDKDIRGHLKALGYRGKIIVSKSSQ